jgi:hypothetical protein
MHQVSFAARDAPRDTHRASEEEYLSRVKGVLLAGARAELNAQRATENPSTTFASKSAANSVQEDNIIVMRASD